MNYNLVETFILGLRSYEMEVGFYDLFTSYKMELEWHYMLCVSIVLYGMLVHGMMLVL